VLNARLHTLGSCVAHLVCRMDERQLRDGHWIMFCHILHAYVRTDYWAGHWLVASPTVPPLLTFLGSKRFAHMIVEGEGGGMGDESGAAVTARTHPLTNAPADEIGQELGAGDDITRREGSERAGATQTTPDAETGDGEAAVKRPCLMD
jgi:hypothetical protein